MYDFLSFVVHLMGSVQSSSFSRTAFSLKTLSALFFVQIMMTFGKESLVTQDYPKLCSRGDSSDPVTWEGKKKKEPVLLVVLENL